MVELTLEVLITLAIVIGVMVVFRSFWILLR